ncbi:hypothetical protein PILCRDRAFT_14392 [Piloderma croceum F 1598]|uniref:Uncharacterized protein n=1 Tax=Piloderma croceum (strain F 1598) TaxID=765440 RepID=A0A0C3AKP6_PILCF|nr:hypothetical protein PILCRDRAFT_14392 [Piloderma croceum F 1598]
MAPAHTPIRVPFLADSEAPLGAAGGPSKISDVRFKQDAAVSAYIIVYWLGSDGKQHSKDLGPWKAINTEEQFILKDKDVPDGTLVNFSSYVSGVGEYKSDTWFTHDVSLKPGVGVIFRQY